MDNVETQYALRGSVDEVKIWDKEIPVAQVEQLKNQWATPAGIGEDDLVARIYPNPAEKVIYVEFTGSIHAEHISLFTPDGREMKDYQVKMQSSGIMIEIPETSVGLHLLRIILKDGRVISRKFIIL
jgi:hypothetical protein